MNRSQSAAESDPELETGLDGLDGLLERSRLWVAAAAFAFMSLWVYFGIRN